MLLKNKNIIFKIRRSKVTDYAALILLFNVIHVKIGPRNKQYIIILMECMIYSMQLKV